MVRALTLVVCLALLLFPLLLEGQAKESLSPTDLRQAVEGARSAGVIGPFTSCFAGTVGCGQTARGRVSVDSCESGGLYGVGYLFNGTLGQRVTIAARSPEFAMSLFLLDGREGNSTIYASHEVFRTGETAQITDFSLPRTGPYLILLTPGVRFTFGDYTMTVSCASAPPPPTNCTACLPNANTACLLNDRFKVTMTWRDPSANLSGNGRIINYAENRPVTNPADGEVSEVSFWSMYPTDTSSVEALVRMIRGSNSFWIFTTGFAAAEYTVTVQDTRTCATWQRTSPFGATEKIADYNALPF